MTFIIYFLLAIAVTAYIVFGGIILPVWATVDILRAPRSKTIKTVCLLIMWGTILSTPLWSPFLKRWFLQIVLCVSPLYGILVSKSKGLKSIGVFYLCTILFIVPLAIHTKNILKKEIPAREINLARRRHPQNGEHKIFDDEGHLFEIYHYVDGKRDGAHKGFYKNGALKSEDNYKGDRLVGVGKGYYKSGKLRYVMHFPDGKFEEYYENGRISQEGYFKQGKVDGTYKYYDQNGILKEEDSFDLCRLKHRNTFDEKGTLLKSLDFDGTVCQMPAPSVESVKDIFDDMKPSKKSR